MKKIEALKLMTIIGTRPEIIRLSEVIKNATNILIRYWCIPDKITTIN